VGAGGSLSRFPSAGESLGRAGLRHWRSWIDGEVWLGSRVVFRSSSCARELGGESGTDDLAIPVLSSFC
jgi:hypothetical protein